ncbi:aryl-alcohol oxidase 3 [Ancistrocladus abbreviatus]
MSLGSPMQQVEEMGCDLVEDLDYDTRHWGLHSAGWAVLGSLHNQGIVPEASLGDIADCSIQNQNQNINHSKGHDSGKSGAFGEPPLLLASSVHCATRAAIKEAKKQLLSWSSTKVSDSMFQLYVLATMPVVKELCGLGMVERYLKHSHINQKKYE